MSIMASEASQKILSYLGKLSPWSQLTKNMGVTEKKNCDPPYFSVYNFMTPLFSCQKNYDPPVYLGPPLPKKMIAPLITPGKTQVMEFRPSNESFIGCMIVMCSLGRVMPG